MMYGYVVYLNFFLEFYEDEGFVLVKDFLVKDFVILVFFVFVFFVVK